MSTTESLTTNVLPSTGTYAIDPVHTHVGFVVKHFGVGKSRGEFAALTGSVVIAEDTASSSTEVEIDVTSFTTGDKGRDGHVLSADFLDAEQFPTMVFRSTELSERDGEWVLIGDLTVRDVTRPVELAVEFEGQTVDPYGNDRIAFSASTKIDRTDFGVSFSQTMDNGGLIVGNKVSVSLDIEATRPAAG